MKPKHLESLLSNLRGFETPKWGLEQYCTPPRLAAEMVLAAASMDDIEGRAVLDLGCGAGMLMAAAGALEAEVVMGLDADAEALVVAQENMEVVEVEADFVLADVAAELPIMPGEPRYACVVVVVVGLFDTTTCPRWWWSSSGCLTIVRKKDRFLYLIQRVDLLFMLSFMDLFMTGVFDTVIMNPPFGTKNQGIDLIFLEKAWEVRMAAGARSLVPYCPV